MKKLLVTLFVAGLLGAAVFAGGLAQVPHCTTSGCPPPYLY